MPDLIILLVDEWVLHPHAPESSGNPSQITKGCKKSNVSIVYAYSFGMDT